MGVFGSIIPFMDPSGGKGEGGNIGLDWIVEAYHLVTSDDFSFCLSFRGFSFLLFDLLYTPLSAVHVGRPSGILNDWG